MQLLLSLILLSLLAYMVAHYSLGTAHIKEPVRIIISVVFAVLYVVFLRSLPL